MRRLLRIFTVSGCMLLCACAHHPLDCALDLVSHDDCLPGTAGYENAQKRAQADATAAAALIELRQQNRENASRIDDADCRSYGLKLGTHDYAECRERKEAIRAQEDISDATNKQNIEIARHNAKAAIAAQYMSKMNQPLQIPSTQLPSTVDCTKNGPYTNCQGH